MIRLLQGVLFDMDGLYVDTEHAWFTAEAMVMTELGGRWTDEDSMQMVGGPLDRVSIVMSERVNGQVSARRIEQLLVDRMADLLEAGAEHRPGADDLLEDLVGARVPCALVSSSPRVLVDAVLASVGEDRFAFTIAGDEVSRTKPHPDPYVEAVRRLGGEPPRCIVLEDSPTGVSAGEAAGCRVVAVPFAAPVAAAPGRVIVGSLAELSPESLEAMLS